MQCQELFASLSTWLHSFFSIRSVILGLLWVSLEWILSLYKLVYSADIYIHFLSISNDFHFFFYFASYFHNFILLLWTNVCLPLIKVTFLSVLNLWNNNNNNKFIVYILEVVVISFLYIVMGDAAFIKLLLWYESEVKQTLSLTKFLLAIKFDELSHTFSLFQLYFPSHHLMFNDKWCCWINTAQTYSFLLLLTLDSFLLLKFPSKNLLLIFYEFYFHVYASDKNETFELNRFILTKCHFSHVNWHKQRWQWQ